MLKDDDRLKQTFHYAKQKCEVVVYKATHLVEKLFEKPKPAEYKKVVKLVASLHLYFAIVMAFHQFMPQQYSRYLELSMWMVAPLTAPNAPPSMTNTVFALPNGEVLHYMDPSGNDACNGTSPSLGSSGNCAWLTPNGNAALKCGDVIIAAAGTYTNNGILVTRQPTSCASTTGGIDGAGGIFTVYVLCATAFACVIPSYNGSNPPGQGSGAIQVQANNWAFEGWHASVSNTVVTSDACFQPSTDTSSVIYHHIIFANNIASNCGYGFGVGISVASVTSGVDYAAFLGNMTFQANQRNDGNETASFVFVNMANSDASTTAIRSVMKGNFAINNNPGANGAPSDVEGMMRDTPQSHGTVGIDVVRDNIIYSSGGPGLQLTNQNLTAQATPYTFDASFNTIYGNNACTPYDPFNSTEVFFEYDSNYGMTVNYYNNIAETRGALGTCSGSAEPNYAFSQGANNGINLLNINIGGTGITNYMFGSATICHATCQSGSAPFILNSGNSIPIPTSGFNVYADPSFKNTTDLFSNHLTLPNCSGFETVTACMGWNFASQTASSLSVIDDLTPQTAGAIGKGYRPPAPCAADPGNLHPPWLKGFGGYLFWTGTIILYKPGYINAPCGT
jgi:hypothetical protein